MLICVIVLWPVRARLRPNPNIDYQFNEPAASERNESQSRYSLQLGLIPEDPEYIRQERIVEARLQTPALLNLPVLVVALPYAIFSPTKNDWVPRGMEVGTWRAISWPFIGVIFWWTAGLGIDALLSARRGRMNPRIRWFHSVLAAVALTCGAFVMLAPFFASPDSDSSSLVIFMGLAGGIWLLLGGTTLAALVLQRKLKGKIASAGPSSEMTS